MTDNFGYYETKETKENEKENVIDEDEEICGAMVPVLVLLLMVGFIKCLKDRH